jgi:hypothetical protein
MFSPSDIVVHNMASIPYANAIGSLIHATTYTHFDIAFAVNNIT